MVITLTMNPCVDKTLQVKTFVPGRTNQVQEVRMDIGGKGLNVSKVLHQFRQETICFGFSPETGEAERFLSQAGIPHQMVSLTGPDHRSLRENLKIVDSVTGVMTECNQSGASVRPEELAYLTAKLSGYLETYFSQRKDCAQPLLFVVNGSVPPGTPPEFYRDLINGVKEKYGEKIRVILDASGILLQKGIEAGPYLIKPNREELEAAFSCRISSPEDVLPVAERLFAEREGLQYLCASLGKDGAVLAGRNGAWFAPSASIPVEGVQGAGDSLVAGLCMGFLRGLAPPELLELGVTTAHGSLLRKGTLLCRPEEFERIKGKITVRSLA